MGGDSAAGGLDGVTGGLRAEAEEAEAARTIAHISNMDNWLSQLEQGLGSHSQQMERVQTMLQQLRRLNFGSLAHAIMALPQIRSSSAPRSSVIVLTSGRGDANASASSRDGGSGSGQFISEELSFWSPTAIAGRQTIVQEQLSTVEQSMTGAEPMVGLRVRISATAKKDSLSAESSRSELFDPAASAWLPQMDYTEGSIGVIRALDSDDTVLGSGGGGGGGGGGSTSHQRQAEEGDFLPGAVGPNLALVEVWDCERSLVSMFWYPVKHLLSRPASNQDAYLGLATESSTVRRLCDHLHHFSDCMAAKILMRLSPYLVHNHYHSRPAPIKRRTMMQQYRPEVTQTADPVSAIWRGVISSAPPSLVAGPEFALATTADGHGPAEAFRTKIVGRLNKALVAMNEVVTSRLIKDTLKVASVRLLRLDTVLCTKPLAPKPRVNVSLDLLLPREEEKAANHRRAEEYYYQYLRRHRYPDHSWPEVMDDYLPMLQVMMTKHPFWCCQLLRCAASLLVDSTKAFHFRSKLSDVTPAGRTCVVWSKRVRVKDAASLVSMMVVIGDDDDDDDDDGDDGDDSSSAILSSDVMIMVNDGGL
eukprot:jgi/Bigna1/134029/aug1.23_g8737